MFFNIGMTRNRDKKTYTIIFPLKTNSAQEDRLDRMYKAGCLLQNKIIEEVQKRHRKIILETSYNDLLKELRRIPKQIEELKEQAKETKDKSIKATLKEDIKTLSSRKTEINKELNAIRKEYGLTEFGLVVIGGDLRKKHGLTKLIDSEQAQVIAGNIWSSYEKFLFSGAKMHFRKRRDFNFLRNKTNATGFKYRSGVNSIVHKELGYIPIIIEENNQFELQALSQTIKYCGIKRVYFGKKKRYYVVITIAGYYPEVFDQKHGQNIGEVGIDVGTSSVAFASENEVGIVPLNPHWKEYDKKLKEISRKMERSLR